MNALNVMEPNGSARIIQTKKLMPVNYVEERDRRVWTAIRFILILNKRGFMDTKTRAESILKTIKPLLPDEAWHGNHLRNLREFLTSQLDEAVKEAEVVRVISLAERDVQNFEDGFAAAREKAAGIAMTHFEQTEYHDDTTCDCGGVIAERIRAMRADK